MAQAHRYCRSEILALCIFSACGCLSSVAFSQDNLPPPPERKSVSKDVDTLAKEGDYLKFSFQQVDVRVFTQIVGDFTGERFTVADDVDGKITVVSPNVTRKEASKLFSAVLEGSGFTIIKEGDISRIIRLPDRNLVMGSVVGDDDNIPEFGLVTRIIHLDHVTASEMRKMLESQLKRKDAVSALDETNHLIITDTVDAVKKVENLVRVLDKPALARISEVIPLKYVSSADASRQLVAAFAENQSRVKQLLSNLPSGGAPTANTSSSIPVIVPSAHSNSILVTGTTRQIEYVKELVTKIDIPSPDSRSMFHSIQLHYVKSDTLAKTLSSLIDKYSLGNNDSALMGRVAVESVPENNTLMINAAPEDFKAVEKLIKSLDVKPKQVHISVLIAEVSEDDVDTLGVTVTALNSPDALGKNAFSAATRSTADSTGMLSQLSSGMFGQGITFGIAHGSYKDANGNIVSDYPGVFNIDAIRGNSKVKILANPSLGAQNNVEAEVSVVDNIPITEATITGSGSDRDVIQNITRMDVGVKLAMTPRIIPDGLVQLELQPSIEAVTDRGVSTDYAPTISKRMVKTTVTVPDGETIVIAGLMRNDESEVKKKIPLLGDIPLLGWLFRWTSKQETKTNILIFVTPTVLNDVEDSRKLKVDFEKKTGISTASAEETLSVKKEENSVPEKKD